MTTTGESGEPGEPAEALPIQTSADVVAVRQAARAAARRLGFSLVEQTKLVTAASELARNTLEHGGGGSATVQEVADGGRVGVRLTFADDGPGIPDVLRALTDGYTTGRGLGLGLGGSKRLMSEMAIDTAAGRGTRVTVVKWK